MVDEQPTPRTWDEALALVQELWAEHVALRAENARLRKTVSSSRGRYTDRSRSKNDR